MYIYRQMTSEQRRELQDKIVGLLSKGFSLKEIYSITGITKENLRYWRRKDQMWSHRIIVAQEAAKKGIEEP